jgi:hypothetical protein
MASKPIHWTSLALALAANGLGIAAGCDASEQLPSKASVANPTGPASDGSGSCEDGATKECHVTVGEEAGILTCLVGHASCNGGSWGPCEGSISSQPAPPPPPPPSADAGADLPQTLSLTDPKKCANDPCDPTCQIFEETPDAGVKAPLEPGVTYKGGSTTSIPAGFFGKGIKEPCGEALDCQFDHYCSAPTSGTCSHSKCSTGAALTSGCDPCVTDICALDPSCCSATGSWSASCVAKVATVCGAFCDGGATTGDCKPWSPGGIDTTCAAADLTIGVPCTDTLPVCNRGTVTAPAGVKVYVYPANSSHFPLCTPPAGDESAQCTVPTAIPPGVCVNITTAHCIGTNSLVGNKTVMVNPTGAVAECHCENNWSDYHLGGCQTSSTAGYPQVVYKQLYTAKCPKTKKVQWSYLTYDSTTPGNSHVKFEAHTGASATTLTPALTLLATAKATPAPDTQVCAFTGGPAGCPVNLYSTLGNAAATQTVLELVITLEPTSDKASAPTLHSWKVTYSCTDSE